MGTSPACLPCPQSAIEKIGRRRQLSHPAATDPETAQTPAAVGTAEQIRLKWMGTLRTRPPFPQKEIKKIGWRLQLSHPAPANPETTPRSSSIGVIQSTTTYAENYPQGKLLTLASVLVTLSMGGSYSLNSRTTGSRGAPTSAAHLHSTRMTHPEKTRTPAAVGPAEPFRLKDMGRWSASPSCPLSAIRNIGRRHQPRTPRLRRLQPRSEPLSR